MGTLTQVLQLAQVGKVYHVDDAYDATPEQLRLLVENVGRERALRILEGVFGAFEKGPPRRLEKFGGWLEDYVHSLPDEEGKGRKLESLRDALIEEGASSPGLAPLKILKEAFKVAGVDVEPISVRKWHEGVSSQESDLLIFDDNLDKAPIVSPPGRELMFTTLRNSAGGLGPHCLLLTDRANNRETELREDIRKEEGSVRHGWHLMGKDRLDDNDLETVLAQKFRLVFTARTQDLLRQKIVDVASTVFKAAGNKLKLLDDEILEQVFVKSSHEEGSWPPVTIERLVMAYYRQSFIKKVYGDPQFHTATQRVLGLLELRQRGQPRVSVRALQLRERYLQDFNTHFLPLSLGDIFERQLTDEEMKLRCDWWATEKTRGTSAKDHGPPPGKQYYIVLAPPCDVAVRKNGRRLTGRRDPRFLCRLAAIGFYKREECMRLEPFLDSEHIETKRRVWGVKLTATAHLPAWLLDLAVLQQSGECRYQVPLDEHEHTDERLLTPPWKVRSEIISDRARVCVEDLQKMYSVFKDEHDRQRMIRCILGLQPTGAGKPVSSAVDAAHTAVGPKDASVVRLSSGEKAAALPCNPSTELGKEGQPIGFSLGVKRIGRLLEPWASDLLTQVAQNLSRTAFPHDLKK